MTIFLYLKHMTNKKIVNFDNHEFKENSSLEEVKEFQILFQILFPDKPILFCIFKSYLHCYRYAWSGANKESQGLKTITQIIPI